MGKNKKPIGYVPDLEAGEEGVQLAEGQRGLRDAYRKRQAELNARAEEHASEREAAGLPPLPEEIVIPDTDPAATVTIASLEEVETGQVITGTAEEIAALIEQKVAEKLSTSQKLVGGQRSGSSHENKTYWKVILVDGTVKVFKSADEKAAAYRAYRLGRDAGAKVSSVEPITVEEAESGKITEKQEDLTVSGKKLKLSLGTDEVVVPG